MDTVTSEVTTRELREWTPPSLRRAQVHKDELTLDELRRGLTQ